MVIGYGRLILLWNWCGWFVVFCVDFCLFDAYIQIVLARDHDFGNDNSYNHLQKINK